MPMSDWKNELDNALNRLGLSPSNYQFGKDMQPLVFDTADIVLESAEDWAKHIDIDEKTGAFLDKQGYTRVVYIKDHTSLFYNRNQNNLFDLESILDDYEELKKVHLTWCNHLQKMKRDGIYADRYVTKKTRTRESLVDLGNSQEQEVYLRPCIACLNKVQYAGRSNYSRKNDKHFFDTFHIRNWFEYCDENNVTQPQPTTYNPDTMPPAEYTDIFRQKAIFLKQQCKYTCQQCNKDCSNDKKNLHCHHKNHNKGDNRWENLEILCHDCHAKHHPHMQG